MKKIIVALMLMMLAVSAYGAGGYTYNDYTNSEYNTYNTTLVEADILNQRITGDAMASVELNPDRKGFSVGIGIGGRDGTYAGAVGVMYGVGNLGFNVKAYDAEGGFNGVSAGVTIGF